MHHNPREHCQFVVTTYPKISKSYFKHNFLANQYYTPPLDPYPYLEEAQAKVQIRLSSITHTDTITKPKPKPKNKNYDARRKESRDRSLRSRARARSAARIRSPPKWTTCAGLEEQASRNQAWKTPALTKTKSPPRRVERKKKKCDKRINAPGFFFLSFFLSFFHPTKTKTGRRKNGRKQKTPHGRATRQMADAGCDLAAHLSI